MLTILDLALIRDYICRTDMYQFAKDMNWPIVNKFQEADVEKQFKLLKSDFISFFFGVSEDIQRQFLDVVQNKR